MLKVVSFSEFSDQTCDPISGGTPDVSNARRGGFIHGTKVVTATGWKPIERIVVGDMVRTLDHGFKAVRRVSTDRVTVPAGEGRPEYLPIHIPSRAAFNGRSVWVMPEQGVALDGSKVDPDSDGMLVVSAWKLTGVQRVTSRTPDQVFDVTTLFFDEDQVIFIEGGVQAFCPAARFGSRGQGACTKYHVADEDESTFVTDALRSRGSLSALANPLAALPAPIPQDPIFPLRPSRGVRRPGRPGRPSAQVLYLKQEWLV